MKKVLVFLAVMLIAGTFPAYAYDSMLVPFKDVPQDNWSSPYIYSLSALRIIDGYEDGTYGPDKPVSREAFAKLLAAASKQSPAPGPVKDYSDVQTDRWSYPYIRVVMSHHWMEFMVNAKKFMPEKPITREEVAASIGLYMMSLPDAQLWGEQETVKERAAAGFADDAGIDPNISFYVYYAVHQKIMEGDLTGFRPKDGITRREAAAVIYRLLDHSVAEAKLQTTGFYALGSYASLNQTPNLDKLTLGWAHLDYTAPGTAKANTETGDYRIPEGWEEVIQKAEQSQKPKQLMINADNADGKLSEFLKDEPARKAFIASAAALLNDSRYRFDGLCIDFEGLISEDNAPAYTAFLKEMKAAAGSKSLSDAVPPSFNYKGYDLKAIGETADEVIVMAYNFTHTESRLPSAPQPLVNETVEDALSKGVPKSKLILGISKQTDQWIQSPGSLQLFHPSTAQVESRLTQPGVTSELVLPAFLNRIRFTDERGNSEIYYENTKSIEMKLWLAKYYGLKGVSLWTMGALTGEDWQAVSAN